MIEGMPHLLFSFLSNCVHKFLTSPCISFRISRNEFDDFAKSIVAVFSTESEVSGFYFSVFNINHS